MNFINYLNNIKYATKDQRLKELWDVEGVIKNKSNQIFKFDLRPLNKFGNDLGKKGNTATKADKMVFEEKEKWIIIDTKELHKYIKKHRLEKVYLNDLISKLDWNIFLSK